MTKKEQAIPSHQITRPGVYLDIDGLMITREDVKACAVKPLTEKQIATVIRIVSNNDYLMQTINECIVDAIDSLNID